jgi:hypothetical protein
MGQKQQIVSRWDASKVLFECELPEGLESGLAMRHALEAATKIGADLSGADLSGADLSGAYLSGADLSGAYLSGADLSGADLSGAYLSGADLSGADLRSADLRSAYLSGADLSGADLRSADLSGADLSGADAKQFATAEQAIENLDKVREIILDNRDRLEMGHWHGDDDWKERSCAEETLCGTTHCLAGWLQVCSTDPNVRTGMDAQLAGVVQAPIAAKMFFRDADEVLPWLEERRYVQEIAEREQRAAERAAKKAAEQGAAS